MHITHTALISQIRAVRKEKEITIKNNRYDKKENGL